MQVRSFPKEGAASENYSAMQGKCLQWGPRTAHLNAHEIATLKMFVVKA